MVTPAFDRSNLSRRCPTGNGRDNESPKCRDSSPHPLRSNLSSLLLGRERPGDFAAHKFLRDARKVNGYLPDGMFFSILPWPRFLNVPKAERINPRFGAPDVHIRQVLRAAMSVRV